MSDETKKTKELTPQEQVKALSEENAKLNAKLKKKDAYAKGLRTKLEKAETQLAKKSKIIQR